MITEFSTRFQPATFTSYYGLSIIPSVMITLMNKKLQSGLTWQEQFKTFAEFYADDLPNFNAIDV